MPNVACACGARYRVPDEAVGRRVRCKKCGTVFRASAPPESSEDGLIPLAMDDLSRLVGGEVVERPASAGPSVAAPLAAPVLLPPAADPEGAAVAPGHLAIEWKAFLRGLALSAVILRHPGSLVTFLILVVLLAGALVLRNFMCLGWIMSLIVAAWVLSYQFNVVAGAANNEDELPDLTLTGGWIEDILAPFFKMLLTRMITNLPLAIFLITVHLRDAVPLPEIFTDVLKVTFGFYDPVYVIPAPAQNIAWALLAAGILLWPMLVLVAALGGVGALHRIDLMLITIGRTFPAYLVAAGVVYLGYGLGLVLTPALLMKFSPGLGASSGIVAVLALAFLLVSINLYVTFLGMRAIGLYYHCFKSRFAWTWG